MKIKIYPKVFKSFSRQKIYFETDEACGDLSVRIQPMEKYAIPHNDLRIDESYRYPFEELKKESERLYSLEYDFTNEQRYTVRVRLGEEIISWQYLYSLGEDLSNLRPFKGDTHLHSCRSDGEGTPFEVAVNYRKYGFDFIAVTDHHRYAPSLEAKEAVSALTDYFTVFPGEEVHNKDMGYFHIINFNGNSSVNALIENDEKYVTKALAEIKKNTRLPENVDKELVCYRIFVANEIRRRGGLAIFAHPFWEDYGEYNAQTNDVIYLLKEGYYDALEVLAGCDYEGNGNNLQEALWADLRAMGVSVPVLGASDRHTSTGERTHFNKQFSIVLAENAESIPVSIKNGLSVAVNRRSGVDFRCIGSFRLVKYARFLMREYYPEYEALCEEHASALAESAKDELNLIEKKIDAYNAKFFAL